MRAAAILLLLAAAASAGDARAVLRVRATDRDVVVRAPSAGAELRVVPKNAARATLDVRADDSGAWRLRAEDLAGGATLVAAGAPFLDFESSEDIGTPAPPSLVEAGDTAIEVPADAAECSLRLEHPGRSIRQDFDGADVFFSGEGPSRAVFLGHVAPDQAGPAVLTLASAAGETSWDVNVYAWRWTATRTTVEKGDEARFRLDVDGLPAAVEYDVTLEASGNLELLQAPGTFTRVAPGRWRARVRPGEFTFRTSTEGDAAVTLDLQPCAR
ncbi:MAG: hypothetical protein HYY18_15270 [Planctomycetes bacterium]|nr:hypothetical protein [Planctomycetota bacterium]